MNYHKQYNKYARIAYRLLILLCAIALILGIIAVYFVGEEEDIPDFTRSGDPEYREVPGGYPDAVENGIHVRTGLVADEGLMEVVNHCTACHSAKLITQNRLDRDGWHQSIRWMQETQNLWDLGESEEVIVNYLVRNYPPLKKGRREPLKVVEWYVLNPK